MNAQANVVEESAVTVAVVGLIVIGKEELLGLTIAKLMVLEVLSAPGVSTLIA